MKNLPNYDRPRSKKLHPDTPSRVKLKIEGKRVLRYRYLMEKKLGRPLRPGEIVHHKNDDKQDDRIENLEVMTQAEHARLHFKGKRHVEPVVKHCAGCGDLFELNKYQRRRMRQGRKRFYCSHQCYLDRGR